MYTLADEYSSEAFHVTQYFINEGSENFIYAIVI